MHLCIWVEWSAEAEDLLNAGMEVAVLPTVLIAPFFVIMALLLVIMTFLLIAVGPLGHDLNVFTVLVDAKHFAVVRVAVCELGRVLLRVGDGVLDLKLVFTSHTESNT